MNGVRLRPGARTVMDDRWAGDGVPDRHDRAEADPARAFSETQLVRAALADVSALGGLVRNERKRSEGNLAQLQPARVIDVNAGDVAFMVQVDHYAGGYLTTLNARTGPEIDVERIGFGVVSDLHGLKPRSRKA